jgi:peptidoglycan/LPS O-acetylase OafA/YrhL
MKYVPSLDGIRAVAIFVVFLFHVQPEFIPGGFIGVDVFFVLSGYLITSKILQDIDQGTFSLGSFYLRRINRLLPNALAMAVTTSFICHLFFPPSMFRSTSEHSLWAIFSTSNVYVYQFLGGYWGDSAESSPLTHTWSLAIEEQFYLVYPLLIVLLTKYLLRFTSTLLVVTTAISFLGCLWATFSHPNAAFYLLPFRAWELLLGGILSLLMSNARWRTLHFESRITGDAVGFAGFGLLVTSLYMTRDGVGFPGWYSVMPTVAACLLILSAGNMSSLMSKILSLKPLVWIGKRSYSIYLWHWPLIVIFKQLAVINGQSVRSGALIGAVLSVIISEIAYFTVEKPMRSSLNRPLKRNIILLLIAILAVSYVSFGTLRRPNADVNDFFDDVSFSGTAYDVSTLSSQPPNKALRYYDVKFLPRSTHTWKDGGLLHLHGSDRPEVVVFGSSHALMYSKVIDDVCEELGVSVAFFTLDGGAPALFDNSNSTSIMGPFPTKSEAIEYDELRWRYVKKWNPKCVIVIDRWDLQYTSQKEFSRSMRSFLDKFAPLDTNVVFIAQVPVHKVGELQNLREIVGMKLNVGKRLPILAPDERDRIRKDIASAAERLMDYYPSLLVIRPDRSFYINEGSIRYLDQRKFLYADDDHLSDDGSMFVKSTIKSAIKLGITR